MGTREERLLLLVPLQCAVQPGVSHSASLELFFVFCLFVSLNTKGLDRSVNLNPSYIKSGVSQDKAGAWATVPRQSRAQHFNIPWRIEWLGYVYMFKEPKWLCQLTGLRAAD